MTFDFSAYVAAIRRRTEAARVRKAGQDAETQNARQCALNDAAAYIAGMILLEPGDAADSQG